MLAVAVSALMAVSGADVFLGAVERDFPREDKDVFFERMVRMVVMSVFFTACYLIFLRLFEEDGVKTFFISGVFITFWFEVILAVFMRKAFGDDRGIIN